MKRWIPALFYTGCIAIVVLGICVALLTSNAGQKIIRSWILSTLRKEGVKAKVESFEGFLIPTRLTLKQVSMDRPGIGSLSIKTLQADLSLLYLLKREIHFKEIKAWDVIYASAPLVPQEKSQAARSINLSTTLSIQSLQAFSVSIDGFGPLYVEGQLKIKSRNKGFFVDLKARKAQDQCALWITSKESGFAKWNAHLYLADSRTLPSLASLPVHGTVELDSQGTYAPRKGLQGHFKGNSLLDESLHSLQGPWLFKGRIQRDLAKEQWSLSQIELQNGPILAKASGSLDAKGNFVESSGQLHVKQTLFSPVEAEVYARWMLRKEEDQFIGKTIAQIPRLRYKNFSLEGIEGVIHSTDTEGKLQIHGAEWRMNGQFSWHDALQLTNLSLEAPYIKGQGQWTFYPDGIAKGSSEIEIENLHLLEPLIPEWDPYGKMTAKLTYDGKHATLDVLAKNLYAKDLYFDQAAFYSDLEDPMHQMQGVISLDLEKGKFRDLFIDSALLETKSEGDYWPFTLFAEGVCRRDFESRCSGVWHMAGDEFTADVADLHGLFYGHPFSLEEPVRVSISPAKMEVSPTNIQLSKQGKIFGQWREENFNSSLTLRLVQFPLDFLSINSLEVSIAGLLDLDLEMKRKTEWQGSLQASINQVEMLRLGEIDPITAQGEIKAKLEKQQLVLEGSLSSRALPLASFAANLPTNILKKPWQMQLLYDKPTKGHVHFDGHIEDCLDFFNLGSHWLEGRCLADLSWSHTLNRPVVKGSLQLQNGRYENYQTGTHLTDLQIEIAAERSKLRLVSFSAKDPEQTGTLSAEGTWDLRLEQKLPFHIRLLAQQFQGIDLGIFSAKMNSTLQIKGNIEKTLIQGDIHLIQSAIVIPDTLTKSPPNLQVVYLNAHKPIPLAASPSSKPYPIHFYLAIDTVQDVSISGKGLQSNWQGKFTLKGTKQAPEPAGQLNLVKGEFSFAGRLFKLTSGSLVFLPQDPLLPQLTLSAMTEQQGISIIANLQGPLSHPQLTFQSVPPLPLSAIIAHLLFGQDISEINGLQALQLATTIANIAGESPDILESTRRSLGIDRLRIVSSQSGEGDDTLSIQVGKYVAPGVLVSISQNAEESAPNISIEVDIGSGFFFQAETDQVHEQGKFGVKWNRNY